MMRLIRYEFIKLFCKKSVLALILLLSAVNFFKIAGEYQSYSWLAEGTGSKSWHSAYWNLYEEYSGEITAEKIKALLAVYQPLEEATADMTASTATDDPDTMTGNLYSDRNLLKKYYVDPMRYFYGYRAASLQATEKAKENALRSQALGQTYEARKNSVIYRLYSERSIPAYAYREMYNYYLNYDFSTVLILLLCLYGICGAFASEKETQMDLLLVTSPNGGRKTAMAKILAVSAFSLFVSVWFSLADYVGFSLAFQTTEGWNLPVYAIENFAESVLNCNLLQYSLVSALLRAVGAWLFGMLMLLLSMFWKNALLPFVLNLGVCVLLVISGAGCAYYSNLWGKTVTPYSLLTNRVLLGKTEFLNIAGHPVPAYLVSLCFALAAGFLMAAAIFFLTKQNRHCTRRDHEHVEI